MDAKSPGSKRDIGDAERAVDRAFSTGKADRAEITRQAQLDAAEAVAMAGIAMESDAAADEAARLSIIASDMGNRDKAKAAREREREARRKAKQDHAAATKSAKRAYEAIKFSDPTKLGFMRLVQLAFLLHIVSTLGLLLLTSRDTIVYTSLTYIDWITVVLEGVGFYFFWNRYKLARPLVIVIAVLGIAGNVVSAVASGTLSIASIAFRNAYYIFIIIYFAFSKRVRSTLANDLSQDKGSPVSDSFEIERSGWPFVRNLIIYFVVFSVLGHWMEAAFCQLIRLGIVQGEFHPENTMLWRDWFYPYPMHGTAVILIALFLYPMFVWMRRKMKNRIAPYALCFVINALVCTAIEFVGGLMFNANLQNWDYSNMPFNFMGQVCLQNAIGFGLASSVIAWWLYPLMERMIARVRPAIMNIVCVVVAIVGGILFSLYAISPPEGIDLGQMQEASVEQQTANEIDELAKTTDMMSRGNEILKEQLDGSQNVPQGIRDDVRYHTDNIDKELALIQNDLGKQGH